MPENKTDINSEKSCNERMLYLRRWRRLERLWAALLLCSLFLLLLYQGWLYWGRNHSFAWLNFDWVPESWYGQDYAEVLPAVRQNEGLWGNVTLELQDYSELHRALVLLNGNEVGNFSSSLVTLRVFDGDQLEIDCTAYARPVHFKVTKVSVGIDRAKLQTELELCGERGLVGRIDFKR